jgi:formylglycine-generating enzyme required for sulfatase activity
MVYVPTGEFIMGSAVGDDDEKPEHKITLPAFYIDRCEISNEQFRRFKAAHKYREGEQKDAVWGVTWDEAQDYAAFAGKRLPTEAEWEKAARGTDGRSFPWGNRWVPRMVPPYAAGPVNDFPQAVSPYGCLLMAGNVWEWVQDCYQPYPGNEIPSTAYGEKYKVIRGGADFNGIERYRCASRYYCDPKTNVSGIVIGFRCALDAE